MLNGPRLRLGMVCSMDRSGLPNLGRLRSRRLPIDLAHSNVTGNVKYLRWYEQIVLTSLENPPHTPPFFPVSFNFYVNYD